MMNIDDKTKASATALHAFKAANEVINKLAYKMPDSEEAKAFKCLVLSRLASIALDCSDEILGVSTAGKEQELTNYLIDYPVQYGQETMLLTGTVRYAYVGILCKKHYKSFDVANWRWERSLDSEMGFFGPTDIDINCAKDLAIKQLNEHQNKLHA